MASAQPKATQPQVSERGVYAGRIGRVIFSRGPDFAVFVLDRDNDDPITVAAKNCGLLMPGGKAKVEGVWVDSRYGLQLSADFVAQETETEVIIAQAFLLEVRGIGEVKAAQLVEHYGATLPEVLGDPKKLAKARGIGKVLAQEISAKWKTKTPHDIANLELAAMGITPGARKYLLAKFGSRAAAVVRENPWAACKANGIGFKSADVLAQRLGVAFSHPGRAQAAVLEAVKSATQKDGSTRITDAEMLAFAVEVQVAEADLQRAVREEVEEGLLVVPAPGVLELSIHDYYERVVAEVVLALSARCIEGEPVLPAGSTLTGEQAAAVVGLQRRAFGLLTGGPGVGKTFTCKAIVDTYAARWPDLPIYGCAPTGRAAKRLEELTGRAASTIHRLLGCGMQSDGTMGWKFNAHCRLPAALVLVDEVSMVDTALAFRLLSAVGEGSTVLFVGDADQLPSVGAGAVLRDLLTAGAQVPCYRLTRIMRQAEGNPIIGQSHAINAGRTPHSEQAEQGRVIVVDQSETAEDVGDRVMAAVDWLAKQRVGNRGMQVLCFGHRSAAGTIALNERLSKFWLPEADPAVRLPVGCLVMQTKNCYKTLTMNGNQGTVEEISFSKNGAFNGARIRWDGLDAPVWHGTPPEGEAEGQPVGALGTVFPAWAMSVWKGQGSEWPWVIISLHNGMGWPLLRREPLYTAFTRARQGVVLVGPAKTIDLASRMIMGCHRRTGLGPLLRGEESLERRGQTAMDLDSEG